MLKLSLLPGEYLKISDDIIVEVYRVDGKRSYLSIHAPREIPIVRGTVLERDGEPRPDHLLVEPKKSRRH